MFSKPSVSAEAELKPPFQVTQFTIPEDYIDLGLGDPQFSLLPVGLLREAARERLAQNDPEFLQYGARQGDGYFRNSLAGFLARGYGAPVDPDGLFITNGVSMGLHLICTLFTHPGDIIFVEEPTYFYALRIFADHALRVIPIQTDADGLMIDSLVEALAHAMPKFLYLIPTFQNPTGRTMPAERRRQLVELSRSHGLLVVADEVYHLLSYDGMLPLPFAAEVASANIISLGSFSKILAPGLRLGWLQSSPQTALRFADCGLLNSGGGMNPFTSAIVRTVVESGGLDANIASLKDIYQARLHGMDAALRSELPALEYNLPSGGYFIWARLPDGRLAQDLQPKAEALRVGFRAGNLFSSQAGMQDYIRLCFVFYETSQLEEGIHRLKLALT